MAQKRLNISVPRDTYTAFKARLNAEGYLVSQVLRTFMQQRIPEMNRMKPGSVSPKRTPGTNSYPFPLNVDEHLHKEFMVSAYRLGSSPSYEIVRFMQNDRMIDRALKGTRQAAMHTGRQRALTISDNVWDRFSAECERQGRSKAECAEEALDKWLKQRRR